MSKSTTHGDWSILGSHASKLGFKTAELINIKLMVAKTCFIKPSNDHLPVIEYGLLSFATRRPMTHDHVIPLNFEQQGGKGRTLVPDFGL